MGLSVTYETKDGAQFQNPLPGVTNGKLAMWLFLVSDAMSFIGLLAAYAAVRSTFPEALSIPKGLGEAWNPGEWFGFFGIQLTALNTFILICSSVTMVQSLAAFQEGKLQRARYFLAATAFGGAIFLGVQAYEWTHMMHEVGSWSRPHAQHQHFVQWADGHGATTTMVLTKKGAKVKPHIHDVHSKDGKIHLDDAGESKHHHALPKNIDVQAEHIKQVDYNLQAATFYLCTGFHGCHVFGGVVLLLLTLFLGMAGFKTWIEPNTIEIVGLYWHFVDLVWILIFTFVYLI